jgi:hypothetical protein
MKRHASFSGQIRYTLKVETGSVNLFYQARLAVILIIFGSLGKNNSKEP